MVTILEIEEIDNGHLLLDGIASEFTASHSGLKTAAQQRDRRLKLKQCFCVAGIVAPGGGA